MMTRKEIKSGEERETRKRAMTMSTAMLTMEDEDD